MKTPIHAQVSLTAMLILSMMGSQVFAEDWEHWGRDQSRFRATPENIPLPLDLNLGWKVNVGWPIISSPAVSNGYVYFGTAEGYVYALLEQDGSLAWRYRAGSAVDSSPTVHRGRVYFGSGDGYLYCLSQEDGRLLWKYHVGGDILSSPLVDENSGCIVIGAGFPRKDVYAINLDGTLRWRSSIENATYSSAVSDGARIYIGSGDGKYYSLSLSDGTLQWADPYSTAGDVRASSPLLYSNSLILLPGNNDLRMHAVTSTNGALLWQFSITNPQGNPPWNTIITSSPMRVSNTVYFVCGAGDGAGNMAVFAVNADTGAATWQPVPIGRTGDNAFCATPAGTATHLFVASQRARTLYVLNASNGEIVGQYTGLDDDVVASPTVANGKVYLATLSGTLYAFQSANRAPSPPTTFRPSRWINERDNTPEISWSGASDDGQTLTYEVRMDNDGEVFEDWTFRFENVSGESVTIDTPLADNTHWYYRVRAKDANLAWSEWSPIQTFSVNRPLDIPEPPSDFLAIPGDGYVNLSWRPSPSRDVKGYSLTWRRDGDAPTIQFVGNVTTWSVGNLTNGKTYFFTLRAVDYDGNESDGLEARATPTPPVLLRGVPYPTLESALAVAVSGDEIILGARQFKVTNTLRVPEGVTLRGWMPGYTKIIGTGLDRVIFIERENRAERTGGISAKTVISRLTVIGGSYGIDTGGASCLIRNVIIQETNAAAIVVPGGTAEVVNNTIVKNHGAAILTGASGTATMRNNIVIRNKGHGVYAEGAGVAISTYNNLFGNLAGDYFNSTPGPGDLGVDVSFLDEEAGDFREMQGSRTVDAGDPKDDYSLEPQPNGGRINMGAFGNTEFATKSPPSTPPPPEIARAKRRKDRRCWIAGAVIPASGAVASSEDRIQAERELEFMRSLGYRVLLSSQLGRRIAELYRETAPSVSSYIHNRECLRAIIRNILMEEPQR